MAEETYSPPGSTGTVKSVNGKGPNNAGAVTVTPGDISAALAGGALHQVLTKKSAADFDWDWEDGGSGYTTFPAPAFGNPIDSGGTQTFGVSNTYHLIQIPVHVKSVIRKVRIRIGAQGGQLIAAMYDAAGTTKLADSGAVACPAVGNADIAFANPVNLDPTVVNVIILSSTAAGNAIAVQTGRVLGTIGNAAGGFAAPASVAGALPATAVANVAWALLW